MKKRNYKDIKFIKNNDATLTLEHLTSEMTVPCSGGGYILPVPCGGGKSTGIISLITQSSEGILLVEKTVEECQNVKSKLILSGIQESEIWSLYSILEKPNQEYLSYLGDPEAATTKRIIITPSVNLYIRYLPSLLAYNGGKRVDLSKYLNNTKSLLTSNEVRKYILIDEQPDFILPYSEFRSKCFILALGETSVYKSTDKDSILKIPNVKKMYTPLGLEDMKGVYDYAFDKTDLQICNSDNKLNEMKILDSLSYIRHNYVEIGQSKCDIYSIYHWLKDLVCQPMNTNILVFDATAGLLSDYKHSPFQLIENPDKSYSSDIHFEEFFMSVERWIDTEKDLKMLDSRIESLVECIGNKINKLNGGKLLIVTWLDMCYEEDISDSLDIQL